LSKMSFSVLSADPNALKIAFEKPSISASLVQLQQIINAARIDLSDFSDGLEYSGFDREKVAQLCAKRFGAKGTAKLILMGVKRGTRVDKILKSSMRVDPDIAKWYKDGLLKSGGKGPEVVSIGRILACFPDCAVLISRLYQVKSKISSSTCPVELQFPAAASLPMSPSVRAEHIEFCKEFGRLIKSPFNSEFYRIAFNSMVAVNLVDGRVLDVLGNPNDREAKAVDLDVMFGEKKGLKIKVNKKGKQRAEEETGEGSGTQGVGLSGNEELQTMDDDLSGLFEP